jgi:hypothetical protein
MKPRAQFLVIVGISILFLGSAYYMYSNQTREPLPVFAATIRYDCAPWDGAAFTVSIPLDEGVIDISIYQSPGLFLPERFLFPDTTGRIGNALLLLSAGVPEELSGEVSFQSVAQENPVEGEFDLRTETGGQFRGKFVAEWDNHPVLCG